MDACLQPFVCPVTMPTIPHSQMSLIFALCQDNQTFPNLCCINTRTRRVQEASCECVHISMSTVMSRIFMCVYLYGVLCMDLHTPPLMSIMPTAGILCDLKSIAAFTANKRVLPHTYQWAHNVSVQAAQVECNWVKLHKNWRFVSFISAVCFQLIQCKYSTFYVIKKFLYIYIKKMIINC